MASSWYLKTKGESTFSGLESQQSDGISTVFDEALNVVANAYDVDIIQYGKDTLSTRVIIESSVRSKHEEKRVVFRKGEIKIGNYIDCNDRIYLVSNWVNEDIPMNDSAPMHVCNAVLTFKKTTKTKVGKDGLNRPIYSEIIDDVNIPVVYDTIQYYSDENKVVNLEKDVIECWIQYRDLIENAINNEVIVFNRPFTIRGILRDMLVVSSSGETSGLLKLRIKPKE